MAVEFHDLDVAGIVQETHDTRSFIFNVPAALREQFAYQAGQFLTFEIPWNDMRIRRCYSLASAPESDPWHKVTVKRVPDGRVSNWFNEALTVGDRIAVQAPEGRFVMKRGEQKRPLTLFGGGSGVTPVISILKSALHTTERDVLLVYANRDARSIIFKDELDQLEKRFAGRVRVHHHLDVDRGFMNVDGVKALIRDRLGSDFYTCGPTPFMDTVEAALDGLGVDSHDRFFERFVSPLDPDRRPAETAPAAPVGDVPESFDLVLEGTTHKVPYKKGLTLLAAANAAGLKPPSSCEDGYCGCCMAFKRSGELHMGSHEALTPADISKGWVLPCQAKAQGPEPIVIDFDEQY